MTDLTPILEALIALAMALITTFLIPWIKEKLDAAKLAKLQYWVTAGVEAAEMIYKGISSAGEEKKKHVIEFLASKNLTVDNEALDIMIESAVYQLQGSLQNGDGTAEAEGEEKDDE